MSTDKYAHDIDLCTIPGEFRENYRFLSELIRCRDKNHALVKRVSSIGEVKLLALHRNLNRREAKILRDFLSALHEEDPDCSPAPVPEELEASIRIRKRSTWLPWEAEAIRKIEKWREDLVVILEKRRFDIAPRRRRKTLASSLPDPAASPAQRSQRSLASL
ncbi:MAG: hypothetical protein ACP5M0_13220 [Desulfomonilaceae bacterium]